MANSGVSGSAVPDLIAVLELLPDPVVVVDAVGTVTWANRTAEESFGWRRADVVGRPGFELIHPDDFGTALVSLESVQVKAVGTVVEVRVLTADGTYRLCEVRGRSLLDEPSVGGIVLSLRDLTDRRLWEVGAGDAALAQTILQHASVITLLTDAEGRVRSASAALVRELGISLESVRGRWFADLVAEVDRAQVRQVVDAAGAGGTHACEATLLALAAPPVRCHLTVVGLVTDPVVNGLIISVQEIDALAAARERLRYLATHDALTALANRNLLYEHLAERLAKGPAALVYADLDGFKPVNDRLGHLAGDAVLREVGRRLAAVGRDGDLVARVGGDEFAIVTTPDEVAARAFALASAFTMPHVIAEGTVTISASIGTAIADQGDDPDHLLAAADAAMYRTKSGRPQPASIRR